ncbi:MAG: S8 family serine peptidase, partial [Candidatus Bathyarchaeia archaeon]
MKKNTLLAYQTFGIVALLAFTACSGTQEAEYFSVPSSVRNSNKYIVILREGNSQLRTNVKIQKKYKKVFQGYAIEASQKEIEELKKDPAIKEIHESRIYFLENVQKEYQAPWGLDRIDQTALPLNSTYTWLADGSGVNAFVVDTGVNTQHVDFENRAVAAFDATVDARNPSRVYKDCNGHGTHVAGTIGGKTYGVAKKVKIYGVKVFACGVEGATAEDIVEGIEWSIEKALQEGKPAVMNLSLGSEGVTSRDPIAQAVKKALDSGITVAIAAGNSTKNACNFTPAFTGYGLNGIITVGATGD